MHDHQSDGRDVDLMRGAGTRVCHQLSQMSAATKWMAPRKLRVCSRIEKRFAPEKRIGLALRAARLAKHWSQEELSFECGLHRTYIGAGERGEKNLTLKNLIKLAKSLDVPASQIMANAGLAAGQRGECLGPDTRAKQVGKIGAKAAPLNQDMPQEIKMRRMAFERVRCHWTRAMCGDGSNICCHHHYHSCPLQLGTGKSLSFVREEESLYL